MSLLDRQTARLSHGQRRVVLRLLGATEWTVRHPVIVLALAMSVRTRTQKRRRVSQADAQRFADSDVRRMQPDELKRYAAVLALGTLALELLRLPLRPRGTGVRTAFWIALNVANALLSVWLAHWLHRFGAYLASVPEEERETAIRQKIQEWMQEHGHLANVPHVPPPGSRAQDGTGEPAKQNSSAEETGASGPEG